MRAGCGLRRLVLAGFFARENFGFGKMRRSRTGELIRFAAKFCSTLGRALNFRPFYTGMTESEQVQVIEAVSAFHC